MRSAFFAFLSVLTLLLCACATSTESNGTYIDNRSTPPKLGSKFSFRQGNVTRDGGLDEPLNCSYAASNADTIPEEGYYVSFSIQASLYVPNFNFRGIDYRNDGDVDLMDANAAIPWIRLPVSTKRPWNSVHAYSQSDTSSQGVNHYHVFDSASVAYAGEDNIVVDSNTVHIINLMRENYEIAIDLSSGDTTTNKHEKQILQYAPSLGFFTMFEYLGSDRSPTTRSTLYKYELKQ